MLLTLLISLAIIPFILILVAYKKGEIKEAKGHIIFNVFLVWSIMLWLSIVGSHKIIEKRYDKYTYLIHEEHFDLVTKDGNICVISISDFVPIYRGSSVIVRRNFNIYGYEILGFVDIIEK